MSRQKRKNRRLPKVKRKKKTTNEKNLPPCHVCGRPFHIFIQDAALSEKLSICRVCVNVLLSLEPSENISKEQLEDLAKFEETFTLLEKNHGRKVGSFKTRFSNEPGKPELLFEEKVNGKKVTRYKLEPVKYAGRRLFCVEFEPLEDGTPVSILSPITEESFEMIMTVMEKKSLGVF